jgi:hypothetical protein
MPAASARLAEPARSVINDSDRKSFDGLVLRFGELSVNLTETNQGALAASLASGDGVSECLDLIEQQTSQSADAMQTISSVLSVDEVIVYRVDEVAALRMTTPNVEMIRKTLAAPRRFINFAQGKCANSAVVQAKANAALGLLDEAQTRIDALLLKLQPYRN